MDKYIAHKKHLIARCEQRGYSVEEVMPCVIEQREGDIWVIDVNHPAYPKSRRDDFVPKNDIGEGVGTELKKILSWMRIKSTPTCSCNQRAKTMNDNGIEWCKENVDQICDWLQEESEKRKIPFFRYGANKLLKLAISRAERNHITK